MSLKLSIMSSRKIGQPNYGSLGAVVGLELEVDPNLLDHPRQLHQRIVKLFALAKNAVDCELTCRERADHHRGSDSAEPAVSARLATARQIRALYAIANRQVIDLQQELQKRLGISRPEELTRDEASELIAALGLYGQPAAGLNEPVQVVPQGSG